MMILNEYIISTQYVSDGLKQPINQFYFWVLTTFLEPTLLILEVSTHKFGH